MNANPYAALALAPDADAELIRRCHAFAEAELAAWYRYITTDRDYDSDLATHRWIVDTPATTPEGWHAKVLACSAWCIDEYDDLEINRDRSTEFLASVLRDIAAPARNAIMLKLRAIYGPLPPHYSAEGIFIGYQD